MTRLLNIMNNVLMIWSNMKEFKSYLVQKYYHLKKQMDKVTNLYLMNIMKALHLVKPWNKGPVPNDKAIYGLGPIEITVS